MCFLTAPSGGGVPLLVSGGSCHVPLLLRQSDNQTLLPVDVLTSGTGFRWAYVSALSQADQTFVAQLMAIYGYVYVTRDDETDTFSFAGTEFTNAVAIVNNDAAVTFTTLGLCEGLTTIRDEEDEAKIALGIWYNGVLYVPTSTEDTAKPVCLTSLNINRAATSQALGVTLGSPRGNLYARTQGIYYEDLTDILSESGLTIRALDCSQQIQSITDFPGIRLQASVTDLWLNG